jgi:hypothetical protein
MAIVSRKEPPRWAVTTIIPALGGASRINFHSSAEKSAFDVITVSDRPNRELCPFARTVAPTPGGLNG